MQKRNHHHETGFTLVELMIVVAIVSVLATLAVFGVRKYVAASKASEATDVIASIRVAEELYRQDTFVYLDVSNGSFDNLHPRTVPDDRKRDWNGNGDSPETSARFRELSVEVSGPVLFSYGVVAGRTGDSFPDLPTAKQDFNFPASATEPFFVALAKGDIDGDGTFSYLLSHSLSNEIYLEEEGE